jgi:hypothetical protein
MHALNFPCGESSVGPRRGSRCCEISRLNWRSMTSKSQGPKHLGRRTLWGGQQDVPEQEWLRQPHPSQEAERPRYARDDAAGRQMRNRKSARVSSMCSPSKRIGWGYSSELSGSPERRSRSEWPISSTTSNALSSCARSPSHDRLVLRKAIHSTHYPTQLRSG